MNENNRKHRRSKKIGPAPAKGAPENAPKKAASSATRADESAPRVSDARVRELLASFRSDTPFVSASAFESLTEIYKPLLLGQVTSFHRDPALADTDREDLLQEASIVLLRAARSYDLGQTDVTFGLYLKICLRNAFVSLIRRGRREMRLQKAARDEAIHHSAENGNALPSDPTFASAAKRPSGRAGRIRSKESVSLHRLAKLFRPPVESTRIPSLQTLREELPPLLTRFEREVFRRFYAGMSYAEIAENLSCSVKSVDNALFRIRRKWRDHFWAQQDAADESESGQENGSGSDRGTKKDD